MSKQSTPLESWKILRREWQKANADARQLRAALTAGYQQAIASGGAGPKQAELEACMKMESVADRLSIELDNLAKIHLA